MRISTHFRLSTLQGCLIMAIFDAFKQWTEKVLDKVQSNDEKILEELYQDQINSDFPREELFKQNIFMGDTTRAERVGEEVASEETSASVDEGIKPREIQSNTFNNSEAGHDNVPEFSELNRTTNSNNNFESSNNIQSFSNNGFVSPSDLNSDTQLNPVSALLNEYDSPFTTDGISQGIEPNPGGNAPSNSNISPVVDANVSDNIVSESAPVGAVIGVTAFAFDSDGSDSVSYSLASGSLDNDAFAIDAVTGEVTVADASALDFENDALMQIEVTATSTDGSSGTQVFNIAITDDTSEFSIGAVSDVDASANSVSESANVGDVVGVTAFAEDLDGSDSVSYSLASGSLDNDAFAIDAVTGEVTVADASALDFENDALMQIEVTATSTDGSSGTQVFNIAITDDTSEFSIGAVSDVDASANSVSESANVGDVVGVTAFAEDLDGSDSVSYSLASGSLDNDAFAIDAVTGEVTVADASALDFENDALMQIEVTATSTDGSSGTQVFNIAITDDTSEFSIGAVSDVDASANSVSESANVGDVVGVTAFAEDLDGSDSVSYSLASGSLDNDAFAIDAVTGEVTVADASALDFENDALMQIEVTATSTDGSSGTQVFNIAITDDTSEFSIGAVSDVDASANSVSESANVGDVVGVTAFAEDLDGSDSVSYSLASGSLDNDAFAIDAVTGEVTVADASALDFENDALMQIEVTATSTDGSSSTQVFNIAITDDTSEFSIGAVSDVDASANSVSESANVGDVVGVTAFAEDLDGSDSVSYSLASGSLDNDAFAIDAVTGEVTVADASALDFENDALMQIEVTATSTDGSSGTQVFNIAITDDTSEFSIGAVSDVDASANSVSESANVGDVVGVTAFAEDLDGSDSVSYSLASGSLDNDAFAIDAVTGEVTVADASALDFENDALMQIEVTATSTDGSSGTQVFNIAITDDTSEFSIGAVSDVDASANSVSESANVGDVVGVTAFAEDLDGSDSVSYSLASGSLDNDAFAIDAVTGEVTVADASALDFENDALMQIEVTATSTDGSSGTQVFNIAITDDTSEFSIGAVSDVDASANSVSESANVGDVVGVTAFAEDLDGSDSVSYSLASGSLDNDAFAIDAVTGEVTVADASALDFENDALMQIEVTATSTDGSSGTQVFNIAITDDTSEFSIGAVSDVDASANSVSESANVGDVVGVTAFAEDLDGSDSVSYSLASGSLDNDAFAIDAVTGEVTVADASALDFENDALMQIEVTATSTDGSSGTQVFNIAITDDTSEFSIGAVSDVDASANSVSESANVGDVVGVTAFAEDLDGSDSVSYSLASGSLDNDAFAIDAVTGEVTVADASALDFENDALMQIEVTATSTDGSSSTQVFNIAIEDVNEGATVLTANVTGNEDTAIPLNIQVTDVEPGANVSVTITGVPNGAVLSAGTDNGTGSWTLSQSDLTGLTLTPAGNSDADFVLSVQTDVTENSVTQSYTNTFNVTVDAVADAPILVGPNTITQYQNPTYNFENGLGNWDILGDIVNPGGYQGQSPTEGSKMARMRAQGATDSQLESELGISSGSLDAISTGDAQDGSSMQTAIAVKEGDVITFDWNFYNAENAGDIASGYNDFAIASINGTPQVLSQSSDFGNPGATGWQMFTFTAIQDGVLDLGFAVVNTNDSNKDSSLLVDNLQINGNIIDTRPVDLNLTIALSDADGSESLAIEVSGVPTDASLSAGTDLGGGIWSIDPADVDGLQLIPSATTSGTVSLTISATSTEANGGDSSTVSQTIDVEFETLDGPIFGTLGTDNITGTANDDVIVARAGNDTVSGGAGDDLIMGGDGNDTLNGDAGDDQLYGGAGNDSLNGGAGNDVMIGGAGNDVAVGGAGDDVYIFEALGDSDSFSGGNGGGWTDAISLDVDISSLPDPSDPWTITVSGSEVSYDVALGYLDLGADASGSITFDDGSEINFDGIEQINW